MTAKPGTQFLKSAFSAAACGMVGGMIAGSIGFLLGAAVGGWLVYDKDRQKSSVAGSIAGPAATILFMASALVAVSVRTIPDDVMMPPPPAAPLGQIP